MYKVDTLNFGDGWTADIHIDEDCAQPYDDDAGVIIVVLHRNYIDPAKGKCGRTPEEVRQWAKDNAREWFITNLYLYDHSGVAYRAGDANPFNCPWDSGQVGIVALKKSEWGKGKGEKNAKRLTYAKSVAEEYGRWANGECYGFVIKHNDVATDDGSCWGHVGFDWACEAAREAYEHEREYAAKRRIQRLKTMIRNRVPLGVRAEELEEG